MGRPGWYKYGPTPGQEGSAVILGHVDSYQGPAVFYRLADLRLGNLVYVKEADGKTLHFAVIGLREYSKKTFPDKLVYGPRKYAALQLVTCGGSLRSPDRSLPLEHRRLHRARQVAGRRGAVTTAGQLLSKIA